MASNILTMCLYSYPSPNIIASNLPPPPRLVRINLDQPEKTEEAEVPLPPVPRNRTAVTPDPAQIGPHKMFADPTGRHLILAMRNGENYYWCSGWKKARLLSKWKGVRVESVAWASDPSQRSMNKRNSSTQIVTTGNILVGSSTGDIYEAVITAPIGNDADEGDFLDRLARRTAGGGSAFADVDRFFRHLFSLSERQAISGLTAVPFTSSDSRSRAGIIATTSTRIYEFVGSLNKDRKDDGESQSHFAKLFEPYKGSVPNLKSELPGDVPHSEMRTWAPSAHKAPKALAWLTGPGVYHGLLSYVNQDVGESVIDSANLLPYPAFVIEDGGNADVTQNNTTITSTPLSILLTEFHFVLLYSNRVMGISILDDRVAFEEELPLKPHERVIGTSIDAVRQTYWIYTDASIFELVIKDEDRDVWKVYLDRGAHEQALSHVKNPSQRDIVLSAQGDRFFKEGRHIQAAQSYAQSFTRTFEEVVLRFLDVDARDALRYYLITRLERLKKSAAMQRTMLATWLVEIYLSELDELEDVAAAHAASQDVENYHLQIGIFDEELKQFMVTYKEDLNERATFTLISRHGRTDVMLHYASIVKQYDRIIRHWIQEGDWHRAIKTLDRQDDPELYYRFATILMRNEPAATVDSWMRRSDLDAQRLIPAMLQHKPAGDEKNHAIRFLQHVVKVQEDVSPAVHNFLFTNLARAGGDDDANARLLDFISSSPLDPLTGLPYYDLDYALRVCAEQGRKEASVRLYSKMGFHENAVDLALESRDVELACYCADLVESDEALRRRLWLKAAKYVVETEQNITTAMEFLSLTNLLSIEDILPFFPDFTVIDAFKEEICLALESYATRIEDLKLEMEQATQSARHIEEDIDNLSQRFVTVDPDEKCGACHLDALQRQFYVFPCRHVFHADCLIAETTRRLPPRTLRRLLDLQSQLSRATSGLIPNVPASVTSAVQDGGRGNEPITMGNLGQVLTQRAGSTAAAAVSGVGLDRLPEALINVLSAGVSVSVAGGRRVLAPLDPFSEPVVTYTPRVKQDAAAAATSQANSNRTSNAVDVVESRRSREEMEEVDRLREEMDAIIAGSCALCEGSLADLNKSFLGDGKGAARNGATEDEWAL